MPREIKINRLYCDVPPSYNMDEKLLGEYFIHARKELRASAIKVDQCREEYAVTFARREAITMPTWHGYIDTFNIVLDIAMEPSFQFQKDTL